VHALRHGARRLDVGRHLRRDRVVQAAFWNGIAWNALNLVIAGFLLRKLAALSRQPS
jgi:hypothetical protein